eukprot:TRINITY_DN5459_c0_g2_i1.p1 TRINITY_DN5459_c0_g2~~TRINITY_DN5459_c0_g2_i1.p1  ORF type:complete len:270 (+),score=60.35 TRINITY_DN5459_c0_g2_i1:70-879(+)
MAAAWRVMLLFLSLLAGSPCFALQELPRSGSELKQLSSVVDSSSDYLDSKEVADDDDRVRVDLYEESLCPYCAEFILEGVEDLFLTGLIDIVKLRFIPYGNAKKINGTIICQHGPKECLGNKIENCAIHFYPLLEEWFPYVKCVVADRFELETAAEACTATEELQLNSTLIRECYSGPLGEKLHEESGKETDALEPKKEYVPWLVVNGQPTYDDYDEIVSFVCDAYNPKDGKSKPAACSEDSLHSYRQSKKLHRKSKGLLHRSEDQAIY